MTSLYSLILGKNIFNAFTTSSSYYGHINFRSINSIVDTHQFLMWDSYWTQHGVGQIHLNIFFKKARHHFTQLQTALCSKRVLDFPYRNHHFDIVKDILKDSFEFTTRDVLKQGDHMTTCHSKILSCYGSPHEQHEQQPTQHFI
jgi:hypothetical protein